MELAGTISLWLDCTIWTGTKPRAPLPRPPRIMRTIVHAPMLFRTMYLEE